MVIALFPGDPDGREREVIQIQMKRDRIECAGHGRIRATDRKGGASQLCVRRRNEG